MVKDRAEMRGEVGADPSALSALHCHHLAAPKQF